MKKASLLSLHTSVHSYGYRTYWCTEETYGTLTIIPPTSKQSNNDAVLAEITALHHLLTVEEVAGKDRTGSDLKIELSRGAIKKILKNPERQTSIYGDHLHWFRTQFVDVKLSVAYSGEREHPYRLNVNTSFLNASPTGVCTPGVHVQSIS